MSFERLLPRIDYFGRGRFYQKAWLRYSSFQFLIQKNHHSTVVYVFSMSFSDKKKMGSFWHQGGDRLQIYRSRLVKSVFVKIHGGDKWKC